ncbi:MAG: hypothetical protein JSS39_11550 [Nitrospira sp.]|nr:hypothetical protein [Nitrospira sp.]
MRVILRSCSDGQAEGYYMILQRNRTIRQNEALEKRIQSAQAKEDGPRAKEKERLVQEQRTRLAKIYESMPSEDAASRLEHMPDREAIEILRLVKAKTAGAILGQIKADRAAKLTEQLLHKRRSG